MCGIWASIGIRGAETALAALVHRGPDAGNIQCFDINRLSVELGHRRLAILDPTPRSDEPISTNDRNYWLTFNGEIYNYIELRKELERAGFVFKTSGDTEVLLFALAHWGSDALSRLVGMFAFVLLDRRAGKLLIARDPFGIKPLFYYQRTGGLAFCTEIPALLNAVGISRRANPQSVFEFLSVGTTDRGQATMVEGIQQFPPGCFAEIDIGATLQMTPIPYWRPAEANTDIGFDDAADAVQSCLERSVALHTRSDVPLGIALSGGIDSSAILGLLRKVLGDDQELHAIGFSATGDATDERSWIEKAAKANSASVSIVGIERDRFKQDLPDLIQAQGEPFPTASIYAQYAVMREAHRQGLKVMLSGQGADEIFAGYRPYLAVRLAKMLGGVEFRKSAHFMGKIRELPDTSATRLVFQALSAFLPKPFIRPLRFATG